MRKGIMTNHILVMGATGTVGRALLGELASRGMGVRGATRDPVAAEKGIGPLADWVEFDLERAEMFSPALRGVRSVFMISRPGDEQADEFARPLIKAMQEAGVGHVVNLSAMGTEQRPTFSLRKVELMLEKAGISFTHLRPNFFMQIHTTGMLAYAIRQTQRIALPAADAKLSFVDARDVAAVAAAVLADPHLYENQSYTLTGPQAVDYRAVAASISKASGREIQYSPIDDDTTRSMLLAGTLPKDRIDRLLEMYRLVRAGACEPISPDVETILGRAAISFERFAVDHAGCW